MNSIKLEKWQKICLALCGAGFVCSLLLFIPFVQNLILDFGEGLVHRPLTRPVWIGRFIAWGVELCALFAVLGIAAYCWNKSYTLTKTQKNFLLAAIGIIFIALNFIPTFFYGILFLCVFYANGLFFARIFKWENFEFSLAFFIGIIIDGIYFSIIHLFFPLNVFTLAPILAITIYEVIFQISKNKILTKFKNQETSFFALTLFFVVSYAMVLSINNGEISYDTYLYHGTLVTWFNEYKIIPGIAALHGRLGMNSLYLIVAAGIDVGIFDKCASCILPLIFASATFIYFLRGIFREKFDIKLYSITMIIWMLFYINTRPSLYYDNPSLALGTIFIIEIYKIIIRDKLNTPIARISIICLLAAGSFGIKQMGAINVLISFMVLAYYCVLQKNELGKQGILRTSLQCLILPFILAVVYIITNLIQTGYPLFPLTSCSFNFPWTLPKSLTQGVLDDILYWARKPGEGYMNAKGNFLLWFIPWTKSFLRQHSFFILIVAIIIWMFLLKRKSILKKQILFFFGITFGSLIYWFTSAPDVRFGSALFFEFFGIALALLVTTSETNIIATNEKRFTTLALLFIWLGTLICITGKPTKQSAQLQFTSLQKIKMLPCKKVLVPNGETPPLYVYVPEGNDDRTGDAPLPCAPSTPSKNFHLFEPGNLQKGFYLDE